MYFVMGGHYKACHLGIEFHTCSAVDIVFFIYHFSLTEAFKWVRIQIGSWLALIQVPLRPLA